MPAMSLDERLERWERAGLLSSAQRAGIRDFEARNGNAGTAGTVDRPGWVEAVAYLGTIVTVAGVLTLVYASSASLAWVAAVTFALGLASLACARTFAGRAAAPWRRASGACSGAGAVALGISAGEMAAATSLFTRMVACCGEPGLSTVSHAGNVLAGAAVGVVAATALMRRAPGHVSALVLVVAAYVTAGACISIGGLSAQTSAGAVAAVLLATSAAVAGLAEGLNGRQPGVTALVEAAAALGATLPLYVLGGDGSAYLDLLGALLSAGAVAVGVGSRRRGAAYAGVVGAAGFLLDVGMRLFDTATARGAFFLATGTACVGGLIALNRAMRHASVETAAPAE